MNMKHTLDEESISFLHELLDCKSLTNREHMIDNYTGNLGAMAAELSQLTSGAHALDRMNMYIHNRLAAHHDAMAHDLRIWLQTKLIVKTH